MSDVIDRINRWLENEDAADADQTLRDARDEIVELRALLQRESESASEAVRLMGANASRYGFLLGGLEMVVAGHTTIARVLETAKTKYGQADEVERLRLTQAEQAAIRRAAAVADEFHDARLGTALRSLLERTQARS